MRQDYTKFLDKQLEELLREFQERLVKARVGFLETSKERLGNIPNFRKEIARIKTEQRRRELLKDI